MPNEIPIKDADVDKEDSDGSTALEVAKQVLGIAKGNAFDAINKYADAADTKKKIAQAKCDALEAAVKTAQSKLNIAQAACDSLCTVLPGLIGTNPACIPCELKILIAETSLGFAMSLNVNCDLGLSWLEGWFATSKLLLWGIHYTIKVA